MTQAQYDALAELFLLRANQIRGPVADSLGLSGNARRDFVKETGLALLTLFKANPYAGPAEIAELLAPILEDYRRRFGTPGLR